MRKILIVIDMQNDFIDGSLGTKEAEAIVKGVTDKIKEYKKEDVFATMDTHKDSYLQSQEGKNLPVEHCIEDRFLLLSTAFYRNLLQLLLP